MVMQLLDYLVKVTIIFVTTFSVGCSIQHFPKAKNISADLILFDGKVYTVDANRSWAEAVAVIDGKIAYVGSSTGAKKYKGPNTRLVDLEGKMLLPGFQDAHVHPIEAGMAYLG